MGNLNNDFSFTIRPIKPTKSFSRFNDDFLRDQIESYEEKISPIKNKSEKVKLSFLPINFTTVYNSTLPSGWTQGVLIPAKGLQTVVAAGAYAKIGKLSIQFYPQFHYAQNTPFEEYPSEAGLEFYSFLRRSVFNIDSPVRFGTDPISNFNLGNSHIMMNLGGISFGLSNENIWSGPGQINSLVLGDNAPGFKHFRIQTTRPLKTFLGSFEGNYWIGQLKGSGFTHFSDGKSKEVLDGERENDWRYFTGITFTYSPKWTPGLSIGLTRGFQIYREDMENSLRAYFPLFAPFQKVGEGEIENIERREDQNVSIFGRWVVPTAKTEFYFEFSRNDHPLRWRDFFLNPEHSRGFLLGFSKYITLQNEQTLGITGEISQNQFSINNIIRWKNLIGVSNSGLGSYDNTQVRHGWTNKGQVLGSSNGISGNSQSMKVGIYSRLNEYSIQFRRQTHNSNFYQYANTGGLNVRPWVDLSTSFNYSTSYKNILFTSELGLIHSKNFNYYYEVEDPLYPQSKNKFNFNLNFSIIYLL